MLGKQILLYNLAKENKSVLEVGVYMGHSMLLMLTSNPNIKITGIDIDKRFSPKAVKFLQQRFPKSKLKLIIGDSVKNLKKINNQFDLFHIDGDHISKKIYNEVFECIRINKKKKIKILFDDVDMMKSVENSIFKNFKILRYVKPRSRYRNLYVEFNIDDKSINNFKKSYYAYLIFNYPIIIVLLFSKRVLVRTIKLILRIFFGKKFLYFVSKFIQKNFTQFLIIRFAKKLEKI